MTAIFRILHRHRAWLVMELLLLLVVFVRFRLREMPLERDEGEFAYAGQLLLQGIPPYKLAYNMKFPGIYGAYALVMLLFGQTAAGIHVGLLLVNAASIVFVLFLGRKLLDLNGGLVAATTFALLSLSVSVLGLAAHASHFVVLAALCGTLLLLQATDHSASPPQEERAGERGPFFRSRVQGLSGGGPRHSASCFASGACFGIAFLMKQPGILWGVFGLLYLAWSEFAEPTRNLMIRWRRESPYRRARRQLGGRQMGSPRDLETPANASESGCADRQSDGPGGWRAGIIRCAWYCLGIITPPVLMCLVLWRTGVLDRFFFWTFTYANEYVLLHPLFKMPTEHFRQTLGAVLGPNLVLWILAVLGMVLVWWDERLRSRRLFLGGFAMISLMAVCPGWYLRQHYFVFALPAAGLLTAVAVNRGLYLVRNDRTIELFLALLILALFPIGLGAALVGNAPVWFGLGPVAASREIYPFQMFHENAEVAAFVREHSPANSRIAVLGSEPEIYFYARRHSATGYIYTYPLMEPHKFALKMQEEMIQEIEAARPEYLVYVKVQYSWAMWPDSQKKILDWYEEYTKANYDLIRLIKDPVEPTPEQLQVEPGLTQGLLLLYERKPGMAGRH